MNLTLTAQVALIAAGVIFLWALLLGVWKYAAIMRSETGQAHVYVDIAHRAALMYSFATALLAAFAQFSAWSTAVNMVALIVVLVFFVGAIASYCLHGLRRDTTNQFHPASPSLTASMVALIIGEVGGSAVILAGFIVEQAGTWG
ncbi:hypothetical protein ACE11G_04465 [Gordonia sp. PS3]|uniref:Integral membrane protein n=1 Tax=Gordonia sihwensis NBRC 108236 TaxID=1223544 RepID=L7LJC4_9ACTN|nr:MULTISPECIES: hypothetical protein [Gordonia]AUH68276.1 hypothetical protein CXX93_07815 [Gordonia sp. YC-JH1]KJR06805.1 membrane protein [Gordonia sihwensis]KXT56242.1 membrane protein [Gordonia sp. QH-12]MBY4569915.1 hypothetical protein [Gordonia sihwensis]WFN91959.1 hypothetical protein P5P27_14425 [Gordonia sihwensis]